MNIAAPRNTVTLLFNPFVFIAGGQALVLGLVLMLLAGALGAISGTHFDGAIDMHTGGPPRSAIILLDGLIGWLSLAVVLLALGRWASSTSFRAIDLFGTLALARWPTVLMALLTLLPGYRRFTAYLQHQLVTRGLQSDLSGLPGLDAIVFFAVALLLLPLVCWMVVLMYRAYSVSCHVQGGRAIGTFIAGLVLAEFISKLALVALYRLAG